jgi:putative endonuclease
MPTTTPHYNRGVAWVRRSLNVFLRLWPIRAKPRAKKDRVGRWGERVALKKLKAAGLIPIKTNWRERFGEIDIVALDKRTLVVVEVKTRHAAAKGSYPALSAIDLDKRGRLNSLGRSFVRNNGPFCRRYAIKTRRIDGIEVYYSCSRLGHFKLNELCWHKGIGSGL